MKKLLLLFLSVFLFAEVELAKSVVSYSEYLDTKYNVDKKIILAYILTESNSKPYSIALKTNKAKLLAEILNDYGYSFRKKGNYVSIFPINKVQAIFIYDFLKKYEKELGILDYDLGIMQINKKNIKNLKLDEKQVYVNVYFNMEIGTKIMRACFDTLKTKTSVQNIIECYNRGTSIKWLNQSKRTYLKRFINNFKKIEKGL